ncbi:hypothetical protein HU200_030123 [Digitaria exilis]|uniref:MICOS complex subunit MIC10 n=1 Tax=Digitaria exilis TaxID=1010633 RepID=A0A835ERF4_9POAL|nr:hypothetical protein HU200_030123 [Digitaria exilis]
MHFFFCSHNTHNKAVSGLPYDPKSNWAQPGFTDCPRTQPKSSPKKKNQPKRYTRHQPNQPPSRAEATNAAPAPACRLRLSLCLLLPPNRVGPSPRVAETLAMAEAPENAAPIPAPPAPEPAPAPAPAPVTSSPPPKSGIPPRYDLDAKWDACLDLSIRRVAYSSLAGAFTGLLLFRSPTTRWASVALGAGVGIGAAYTECSYLFNGAPPKWLPKV